MGTAANKKIQRSHKYTKVYSKGVSEDSYPPFTMDSFLKKKHQKNKNRFKTSSPNIPERFSGLIFSTCDKVLEVKKNLKRHLWELTVLCSQFVN